MVQNPDQRASLPWSGCHVVGYVSGYKMKTCQWWNLTETPIHAILHACIRVPSTSSLATKTKKPGLRVQDATATLTVEPVHHDGAAHRQAGRRTAAPLALPRLDLLDEIMVEMRASHRERIPAKIHWLKETWEVGKWEQYNDWLEKPLMKMRKPLKPSSHATSRDLL